MAIPLTHRDHRITQNRKVRSATHRINHTRRLLRVLLFKHRRTHRRQVPACRKSHHPDLPRIHSKLPRLGPHGPNCPSGIHVRHRKMIPQFRFPHAILHHHRRHPTLRKPLAHLLPFVICRQPPVPTAWKNNHPRPIRILRLEQDVLRHFDLRKPPATFDLLCPRRRTLRSRCLPRPQIHPLPRQSHPRHQHQYRKRLHLPTLRSQSTNSIDIFSSCLRHPAAGRSPGVPPRP